MKKNILLIILIFVGLVLTGCVKDDAPVITVPEQNTFLIHTSFDPLEGVSVSDTEDGDLTDKLTVTGYYNIDRLGTYNINYKVKDSVYHIVTLKRTITVKKEVIDIPTPDPDPIPTPDPDPIITLPVFPVEDIVIDPDFVKAYYPQGVNLSKLSNTEKSKIIAQLEQYTLLNGLGGVPLSSPSSYYAYSSRTTVYAPTYVNKLGFGDKYSTLTVNDNDDSILFQGGELSSLGATNFTFRDYYIKPFTSYSPWTSEYSPEYSKLFELTNSNFYGYNYSPDKTSSILGPVLASSNPTPVYLSNGKSTEWTIPIKDNVRYAYTGTTGFGLKVNGEHVRDLFIRALNGSIVGVGNYSLSLLIDNIQGAKEYYLDPSNDNAKKLVGIAGTENSLTIKFKQSKTSEEVMELFANPYLSPLANDYVSNNLGSIGGAGALPSSTGAYVIESVAGGIIALSRNSDYVFSSLVNNDAYTLKKYDNENAAFASFQSGYLDVAPLPYSRREELIGGSQRKEYTSNFSVGLAINAFGNAKKQEKFFTDRSVSADSYTPVSLFEYPEMRKALLYAVGRSPIFDLPRESLLINDKYYLGDNYYRSTDAAKEVLDVVYGGNADEGLAKEFFVISLNKAIKDNKYKVGNRDQYNIINVRVMYDSLDKTVSLEYLNTIVNKYNTLFVDDMHFIKLQFILVDINTGKFDSDILNIAQFDLAVVKYGNIDRDSTKLLRDLADLNKLEYLNWGAEKNTPNVMINYINQSGIEVKELWSYNAVTTALFGLTFIENGVISLKSDSEFKAIHNNLDLPGINILDIEELTLEQLSMFVDTRDFFITMEFYYNLTNVKANLVTTDGDINYVIISGTDVRGNIVAIVEDRDYKPIYKNVNQAIQSYMAETVGNSYNIIDSYNYYLYDLDTAKNQLMIDYDLDNVYFASIKDGSSAHIVAIGQFGIENFVKVRDFGIQVWTDKEDAIIDYFTELLDTTGNITEDHSADADGILILNGYDDDYRFDLLSSNTDLVSVQFTIGIYHGLDSVSTRFILATGKNSLGFYREIEGTFTKLYNDRDSALRGAIPDYYDSYTVSGSSTINGKLVSETISEVNGNPFFVMVTFYGVTTSYSGTVYCLVGRDDYFYWHVRIV